MFLLYTSINLNVFFMYLNKPQCFFYIPQYTSIFLLYTSINLDRLYYIAHCGVKGFYYIPQ